MDKPVLMLPQCKSMCWPTLKQSWKRNQDASEKKKATTKLKKTLVSIKLTVIAVQQTQNNNRRKSDGDISNAANLTTAIVTTTAETDGTKPCATNLWLHPLSFPDSSETSVSTIVSRKT
jgi:hypothetical protein